MTPGEAAEAALVDLLERLSLAVGGKASPIPVVEWAGPPGAELSDVVRTGQDIIRAVELVTGVSHVEFISPRRCKSYCEARQIAYWFMRHYTALSFPQIGRMVGMRDHSTVMHGIKQVNLRADLFRPRVQAVARLLRVELPQEVPFQ